MAKSKPNKTNRITAKGRGARDPGGRPSPYNPRFAKIARAFCEKGATDIELADILGVTARTVYRWKVEYPEFCQACAVGKENANDRVEASLFKAAIGYEHDDEVIKVVRGRVVRLKIRKKHPPDIQAACWWLANRDPDRWKMKPSASEGGEVSIYQLILQSYATPGAAPSPPNLKLPITK